MGYDGPRDEIETLDSADNVLTKIGAISIEAPCLGMQQCEMIRPTSHGNGGAPILSKEGLVLGLVVQHDTETARKGRFLHIGGLADFLSRHAVVEKPLSPLGDTSCKGGAPRLELKFYKYAGIDERNGAYFSAFHGIVREKITQLRHELNRSGINLSYLNRLSVNPASSDLSAFPPRPDTDNAIEQEWANRPEQLMTLWGILWRPPDRRQPMVRSSIYWGSRG